MALAVETVRWLKMLSWRAMAEVGDCSRRQIALIDGIEQLDRAHHFELGRARPGRRSAQRHLLVAKPRTSDLAVIGGRILRCPLIMGARLLGAAHGVGGAALPITGTRHRDRVGRELSDAREMSLRGRRVVEETERNPAGSELMLDAVVFFIRRGRI